MFNIERKRALLTGAASGIGRAIALQMSRRNTHLCLIDIQPDGLEETAAACRKQGVYVHTIIADLSQEETIPSIAEETSDKLGGLDILINNAGLVYYGPTDQMSSQQRERLLAVNFLAPIRLCDACFPLLLANKQSRILNVSSVFGLLPSNRNTIYHATKYGLVGYSLALRAEYARYGLGVGVMCPGFVRTDLFENMLLPEGRSKKEPPKWMTTSAEVVARKSIRTIEKNRRLTTVTAFAKLGYYLERISPWLADSAYQFQRKKLHDFAIKAQETTPEHITSVSGE